MALAAEMSSNQMPRPLLRRKRKVGCKGKLTLAFLGTALFAGYFVYARTLLSYASKTANDNDLPNISSVREFVAMRKRLNGTISERVTTETIQRDETSSKEREYHVVFSTSCSVYQEWQSTTFFYFANKVKQPGKVTRIVSGCKSDQELRTVADDFRKRIAPLSPNFSLHATPNFDFTKEHNKYMNKPYGVLDWMEKELGYSSEQVTTVHDDAIIMLMDPDMMLLKPITHEFDSFPLDYWLDKTTPIYTEVDHGRPIAQHYSFGWYGSIKDHLREVVLGDENGEGSSPIFGMKQLEQSKYNAGPPYLATARDFYRIVSKWVDVAPRVHRVYRHFMAEMHSYAVAAAHVGLPHQLTRKFMISNADVIPEAWDFLQDIDRKDACRPDLTRHIDRVPFVLHYCQRYGLGRWFIGKYQLPSGMMHECKAPMLRRPPSNVGAELDWFTKANGREHSDFSKDEKKIKMNAFAMCTMMDNINEVATSMRQNHCRRSDANYNESHIFIKQNIFEDFLRNPVEAAAVREGKK